MEISYEEMRRYIWDSLKEQASRFLISNNFTLYNSDDGSECLLSSVQDKILKQKNMSKSEIMEMKEKDGYPNLFIAETIKEICINAYTNGIIVPHFDKNAPYSLDFNRYRFTTLGINFLKNGELPTSTPALLFQRLEEIIAKYKINKEILYVLREAYKCWTLDCLRASMILIGVSLEETLKSLLDILKSYPFPPTKTGTANYINFMKAVDPGNTIKKRWDGGFLILKAIKQDLKKQNNSQRYDWWNTWEVVPDILNPYFQAVRTSRNIASHSVDDNFTVAQIGLLLANLPFVLESIGELKHFLQKPPKEIKLPEL